VFSLLYKDCIYYGIKRNILSLYLPPLNRFLFTSVQMVLMHKLSRKDKLCESTSWLNNNIIFTSASLLPETNNKR
jgi:hypothetical protein